MLSLCMFASRRSLPLVLLSRSCVGRPSRGVATDNSIITQSKIVEEEEPLWKNPEKHALPKQTETYSDFKEADIDWDFVERLMPLTIVPDPPKNCGVLPSGWRPPQDPAPKLPYYIRRNRKHLPELPLERRRDELNPKTMNFEYVELVTVRNISGDVFACERDMRAFLEEKVGHPVATHVDELKGHIKVKGADRAVIEKFIFEKGF